MNKVYAFKNIPHEVIRSSSGGAYIALCKVFENKYKSENVVFYGATFDKNMNVVHDKRHSSIECKDFQGSKYVKSNYAETLNEVKNDLNNNKYVLFSGTPCQIFSLKKFLQVSNVKCEKLYCIDIICHGSPHKKYWNAYKEWIEKKENSKLIKYSFRYKPEGWKAYPAYAEFENGNKKINTAELSVYSKLHMAGYITEKACFSCKFSNMERIGDITLGDYWGIEHVLPNIDYKNGVSLIISNSNKGDELINELSELENVFLEKTDTNIYLKFQHNLNCPTKKPENYDDFQNDFQNYDFETVLRKYLNYGMIYSFKHKIKKLIRKTPIINIYRSLKSKIK